jgi:hypothetical protein
LLCGLKSMPVEDDEGTSFDGELPPGSILLKENCTGTEPSEPGDLHALTIFYKVEGVELEAQLG